MRMAELVGWSGKKFVEECLHEIVHLYETPADKRTLPKLVALMDAARKHEEFAAKLAPPASSANAKAALQSIVEKVVERASGSTGQSRRQSGESSQPHKKAPKG